MGVKDKVALSVLSALSRNKFKIDAPTGFAWSGATIDIFRNGLGVISTDFDVADYEITGKTYYVSPIGADGNDGLTWETAFRTINHAVIQADVDVIIVAAGTYRKVSTGYGLGSGGKVALTRSCTIKAKTGDRVIFSCYEQLTWALEEEQNHTYKATRSNVGAVYDSSIVDANGDYEELTFRTSAAEVEANPGSWYTDNISVWVHTSDSRVVDNYIRPYFKVTKLVEAEAGTDLYLEGIDLEGGATCVNFKNTALATGSLYMKNCTAKYATTDNAITINGATSFYAQGCTWAQNYLDGANVHIGNSVIANSIEIDCMGRDNGKNTDDIHNGSTTHDGGKFIRINCQYLRNKGPNVGDINTDTMSWNLGCVCHNSAATTDLTHNSNFVAHTNAKVWLDSCRSYGSANDYTVETGATLYIRNCHFEVGANTIEGTGQVVNY